MSKCKKEDQINGSIWSDPEVPNFKDIPNAIHRDNPNPTFRKPEWYEIKFDYETEKGPPWDKNFVPEVDVMVDSWVNNWWRQFEIDRHIMNDVDFAEKYPEECDEWIPDESINEYKNHFIYLLEQDIVYTDVGGIEPTSKEDEHIDLIGSDLRINQPGQTVKNQVITLRDDLIPTGDNVPKNNIYDNDPWMFAFDNDRQEWRHFNIRRIHHMWNMHFRKWYADQHWIMDKLQRFDCILDYKIDQEIPNRPNEYEDPNLIRGVNVTLILEKIPHPPRLTLAPIEPQEARFDPECNVVLWNIDKREWLTIKLAQIYNMKILEDKTPPPPEESDDFDPTTVDGNPNSEKKPEFKDKVKLQETNNPE